MRRDLYRLLLLCALLLTLLGAGCTSRLAGAGPAPAVFPESFLDQLPTIPRSGEIKATTETDQLAIIGIDAILGSPGAIMSGDSLILPAEALGLKYAIYQFNVEGYEFEPFSFTGTISNPAQAWFGIANHSTNRWSFVPATAGVETVGLPSGLLNSEDGFAHLAVIGIADVEIEIDLVSTQIERLEWEVHTIDLHPNAGEQLAATLIQDRVYVAYSLNEQLRLARAEIDKPVVQGHWNVSIVYEAADVDDLDLIGAGDVPGIAYTEDISYEAWFVRSMGNTPEDITDWVFNSLEVAKYRYITAAEIAGRPAVSYVTAGVGDRPVLRYARANDPIPSSTASWDFSDIYRGTTPGENFVRLDLVDSAGQPAIAFRVLNDPQAIFARCPLGEPTVPEEWIAGVFHNVNPTGFYDFRIGWLDTPCFVFCQDQVGCRVGWGLFGSPDSLEDWRINDISFTAGGNVAYAVNSTASAICYQLLDRSLVALVGTGPYADSRGDWLSAPVADYADTRDLDILLLPNGEPYIVFRDDAADELCAASLSVN